MAIVPESNREFRFGSFEFSCRTGELRKGRTKLKLNGQTCQILTALLEKPGELVTRDELRLRLWPDGTFVDFDHSLNAAVNRLRQRLSDSAEAPRYVETIAGHGYRFIAAVSEVAPPEADGDVPSGPLAGPRPHTRRGIAFAAFGLLLLTASIWLIGSYGRRAALPALALLPFENVSADSGQDAVVDGMSDAVNSELGRVAQLRVITSGSTAGYKKSSKPLSTIGSELGVDYVLQGAVERSGGSIRLTMKLRDPKSGVLIWSAVYDRELGDLGALQREIARAVAREVKIRTRPGDALSTPDQDRKLNPEAVEAYLKARHFQNQMTETSLNKSIELFQEAIALEPGYASAYANLAESFGRLSTSYRPPREVMPQAEKAAARALELDENSAEAHAATTTVSILYGWDWAKGRRHLRRALELNPSNVNAHLWNVMMHLRDERVEDARDAIMQVRRLDPISLLPGVITGFNLMDAGQYDLLIASSKRQLDIDPEFVWAHSFLGWSYAKTGRLDEGLHHALRGVGDGTAFRLALLGEVYVLAGRRKEAEAILARLRRSRNEGYVCAHELAAVELALGQKERALASLETAYGEKSQCMPFLEMEPRMDALRPDARFQALLARIRGGRGRG